MSPLPLHLVDLRSGVCRTNKINQGLNSPQRIESQWLQLVFLCASVFIYMSDLLTCAGRTQNRGLNVETVIEGGGLDSHRPVLLIALADGRFANHPLGFETHLELTLENTRVHTVKSMTLTHQAFGCMSLRTDNLGPYWIWLQIYGL